MKSVTVRLPDSLVDEIEAEARQRKVSASEIVRERLSAAADPATSTSPWTESLTKLVGGIDALPVAGDSRNIKAALKASGYGRNRSR